MPDLGGLLDGLNIMGIVFGIIGELTFLFDIFIVLGLVIALLRGLFKKFWKVVWKSILTIVLLLALVIIAPMLTSYVGGVPLAISYTLSGVDVQLNGLGEVISGLIVQSGATTAYAEQMTEVILQNFVMIVGVPVVVLVSSILSLITYPLIALAIPKKLKKIKGLPVKLALSLVMSIVVTLAFALPFTNLVPPMSEFKELINPDALLGKIISEEFVGVLELFTNTKSVGLRILNPGGFLNNLALFSKVDGGTLKDGLTTVLDSLNKIELDAAA